MVLLRGVNVSASTRISMSDLRDVLGEAGFEDVRTHLQSGNALITGAGKPDAVATDGAKHFVTFLSAPHDPVEVQRMATSVAGTGDEVHADEREIYLWCPDGLRNSPLAESTLGRRKGPAATVRNFNTVTRLVAMLDDSDA